MNNMMRLAAVILASVMLFASCKPAGNSDESTTPQNAETAPVETTDNRMPYLIDIISDGVSRYDIIYPDGASSELIGRVTALCDAIGDVTGVIPNLKSDKSKPREVSEDAFEILIGECDRAVTKALYATPAASLIGPIERSGYAELSWHSLNKFVFYGTDDVLTRYSIDWFINNVLSNPEYAGQGYLRLYSDFNHRIQETEISPAYLVDQSEENGVKLSHFIDVPAVGDHNVLQGGCTDGEYFYIVLENQSVSPSTNIIRKIDVSTRKIVLDSEPISIDHGNDLCYNANLGQIVAVHNAPNRDRISFIDPETLKVVETKTIMYQIFSMSYNPETDRYVLGLSGGQNFVITDSDFNYVGKRMHVGLNNGYTTQGIDSDDKYIYFLLYKVNCIVVFDWSGKYIKTILLTGYDQEPESIFHIGPKVYVAYYTIGKKAGGAIYRVDITAK